MKPFISEIERVNTDLLHLLDGLSQAQWMWSPSPKSWPVARCVDHINMVNGLVIPRIEAAVQQAIAQSLLAPGPFRYPIFDRLFVFALEPRAPVKQQAPGMYRPEEMPDYSTTRSRFMELQIRLSGCARSADGLDLVKIKIPSPVSDLLRFSLGTWFQAILAPEQNHFEQAQRITRLAGFPRVEL